MIERAAYRISGRNEYLGIAMNNRSLISLFLTILSLSACSPDSRQASEQYHVRFVTPQSQAVLRGKTDVKLDIALPEPMAKFEVGVDGQALDEFTILTGTLRLNTLGIPNGKKTLVAKVTGASGKQWSDSIPVEVKNASHQLQSYQLNAQSYTKGDVVVVDLVYPVAGLSLDADFSALDDTFSHAALTTNDLGGGQYQLTYTISPKDAVLAGHHEILVSATNSAHETATSPIDVTLLSAPKLPLLVTGGTFAQDAPPVSQSASGPAIQNVTGADSLYSGVAGTVTVAWAQSDSRPADRIFLRSPDYSGYYVVPLVADAAGQAAIELNLPFAEAPTPSSNLNLQFAAADSAGNISNWQPYSLKAQLLTKNSIEILLTWNNSADLDLSVLTPAGNTINYRSPLVDGGKLELDANSMCASSMSKPTEAVTWPIGAESAGSYTVAARIYSACGQTSVDYKLTVIACGMKQEFPGTFSASAVGTDSAFRTLAPINIDCISNHIAGKASFYVRGTYYKEPAVAVPVRAIQSSGASRVVLAETVSDSQGFYSLYLPSGTLSNYSIEVEASYTPPNGKSPVAQVLGLNDDAVYRFTTAGPVTQSNQKTVDVTVALEKSGAFNIVDNMRRSYDWIMSKLSVNDAKRIQPLKARWTRGKDTPKPGRSYYNLAGTIFIGALDKDQGEFDDSVICHEFMHHVGHCLGLPAVGGYHTFNGRTTPALAFSEGAATALGQQVLGDPTYRDVNGDVEASVDLETPLLNLVLSTQGTDTGTTGGMTGNLSEFLVSEVLWDLMDPVGGLLDPADRFDSTYKETLGSIADFLPLTNRVDRGAAGVDLVDFLDGWRCRRPNLLGDYTDLKVLLDDRMFPYSFAIEDEIKCL